MEELTSNLKETESLLKQRGLVLGAPVTKVTATQEQKPVWDVTLLSEEGALPHSIFTNGFITHNSSDPVYIENMHGHNLTAQQLFGMENEKGEWVIEPRIHYYQENVAELFFDSMKSLMNKLPNKVWLNGKWWYEYPFTKKNQSKLKEKYDKKLFSKHKRFYVPAPDGKPQMVIALDSYPAMLPERSDEREEGGGGVGEQARMFSENIKKIHGKLRRKSVILLGVNQLRLKPMSMGNPEYEPGGQNLKFASDSRTMFRPRVIPHGSQKGYIEKEKSVLVEGEDNYRYIHMRNIKNKQATPFIDGWMRLWIQDAEGIAHGVDPVYDVFQYLKTTGQCTGTMKKMNISIGKLEIEKLTWLDFKRLILCHGIELKKVCKKYGITKNPHLRELCFRQLKSGKGEKLFYEQRRKVINNAAEDED